MNIFPIKQIIFILSLLSFSASASGVKISGGNHFPNENIKRVISLSQTSNLGPNNELLRANQKDGYYVEIERFLSGQLSTNLVESAAPANGSVGFRGGISVVARTFVKSLAEYEAFNKANYLAAFHFGNIKYMKKQEGYTYGVEGNILLGASAYHLGASLLIGGSWKVNVEKLDTTLVQVELSLINSQSASVFGSAGWASLGADLGQSLNKGFLFTMDLKDPQVQRAYDALFKGNVKMAQELVEKNPHISFRAQSEKQSSFKGSRFTVRSPVLAWLIYNRTFQLTENHNKEALVLDDQQLLSDQASYTEKGQFNLLGYYHGNIRKFEVTLDKETKTLKANDLWEEEYKNSNKTVLEGTINHISERTFLDSYINVTFPLNVDIGYAKLALNINYSPRFIESFIQNDLDFNKLRDKALNLLDKNMQKKMDFYGPISWSGLIQQKQIEKMALYQIPFLLEKDLNIMRDHFQKKDQTFLNSYARFMKNIYNSPYFYKVWFEEAKKCGLSLRYEIASQGLSYYQRNFEFKETTACQ